MYKITFPEDRQYTGVYLSVSFVKGEADTESKYLASRFRGKGMIVEEVNADAPAFTCPICQKAYKTQKGLDDHMTKEHPQGQDQDKDQDQDQERDGEM